MENEIFELAAKLTDDFKRPISSFCLPSGKEISLFAFIGDFVSTEGFVCISSGIFPSGIERSLYLYPKSRRFRIRITGQAGPRCPRVDKTLPKNGYFEIKDVQPGTTIFKILRQVTSWLSDSSLIQID